MTVETSSIRVGDLMTIDPVIISPDASASDAERLLKTHHIGGLPVVDGGEAVGVISQSDVMVARSSEMISGHWDRLRVRHLMSVPAITVHASATIQWAARQMVTRHIHRLVVVGDDGAPVGVVTPLDLLRTLIGEAAEPTS